MSINTTISMAVEKVSKNNKTYFVLEEPNGAKFTVWDTKIFPIIKGLNFPAKVSISFEQEGNFRNVTQLVPSEHVSGSGEVKVGSLNNYTQGVYQNPNFNDKKDKRISRLACINASIEYHKLTSSISQESVIEANILATAAVFEKWVYRNEEVSE